MDVTRSSGLLQHEVGYVSAGDDETAFGQAACFDADATGWLAVEEPGWAQDGPREIGLPKFGFDVDAVAYYVAEEGFAEKRDCESGVGEQERGGDMDDTSDVGGSQGLDEYPSEVTTAIGFAEC